MVSTRNVSPKFVRRRKPIVLPKSILAAGVQLTGKPEKLMKQAVAGIPDVPLADDAEALTGRPANQHVQLAAFEAGGA